MIVNIKNYTSLIKVIIHNFHYENLNKIKSYVIIFKSYITNT